MAVYRTPQKCPKCGRDYNGIYRANDGTFLGDDFLKWDIERHICTPLSDKTVGADEARLIELINYDISWAKSEISALPKVNDGTQRAYFEGFILGAGKAKQRVKAGLSQKEDVPVNCYHLECPNCGIGIDVTPSEGTVIKYVSNAHDIFRNFIRTEHLSAKWEEYLKENPIQLSHKEGELTEENERLRDGLQKTIGLLFNIRHETDYMPDSYYEWIDKVINETDDLIPPDEEEALKTKE